jgi:hypothetical protein
MRGSIRYSLLAVVLLIGLLLSPALALASGGLSGTRKHPAFAALLAGSFSPDGQEESEPTPPAESQSFQGAEEEEPEEESVEEETEGEGESGNASGGRRAHARCVVPAVGGESLAVARTALRKAHCSLGKVSVPHLAHTAGSLVVVHQSRPRGKRLKRG